MITLKVTDNEASMLLTALRSTVEHWAESVQLSASTAGGFNRLALEQFASWRAFTNKMENMVNSLGDEDLEIEGYDDPT